MKNIKDDWDFTSLITSGEERYGMSEIGSQIQIMWEKAFKI